MGIVASTAKQRVGRPLRTFNVEERAMKVISRDKPIPAPAHPSMRKIMDDIMKDPSKLKSSRADPHLLQNLSEVHITSEGHNPRIVRQKLPTNRTPPDELLYGYDEPKVIPPGKASLRQLLEIIADNTKDPSLKPDVEKIAKDYKLDIVDVMNILQHCKTFSVFHPPVLQKEKERNPLRRLQDGIDNLKK